MTPTLITQYMGQGIAAARPATPAVAAGYLAWYYATYTGALSYYANGAWRSSPSGIDLFNPPLATSFPTIINAGGAAPTPDTADGMLVARGPTLASDGIRAAFQNVPNATTFRVVLGVRRREGSTAGRNAQIFGVVIGALEYMRDRGIKPTAHALFGISKRLALASETDPRTASAFHTAHVPLEARLRPRASTEG